MGVRAFGRLGGVGVCEVGGWMLGLGVEVAGRGSGKALLVQSQVTSGVVKIIGYGAYIVYERCRS